MYTEILGDINMIKIGKYAISPITFKTRDHIGTCLKMYGKMCRLGAGDPAFAPS